MKPNGVENPIPPRGVTELIRYEFPDHLADSFPTVYKAVSKYLHASPYFRGVRLLRGIEEPGRFTVVIEWDSIAGHEQGFTNSPEFPAFIEPLRPYLPYVEEMLHYSDVDLT